MTRLLPITKISATYFDQTIENSDMVVLGVNHHQFKQLPLAQMAKLMRNKNLFDTRNFVDRQKAEAAGFKYYLLGEKYN